MLKGLLCILCVFSASISLAKVHTLECDPDVFGDEGVKRCQLIEEDITALARMRFQNVSPLHQKFFGNEDGALGQFILQHLRRIQITEAPHGSSPYAAAAGRGGTLYIYPGYFQYEPLRRYMMLVHEADHLGPDEHDHTICPTPYTWTFENISIPKPALAGFLACDHDELGAYAHGFVFLRSIEKSCVNCESSLQRTLHDAMTEAEQHIDDPAAVRRLHDETEIDSLGTLLSTAKLRTGDALVADPASPTGVR